MLVRGAMSEEEFELVADEILGGAGDGSVNQMFLTAAQVKGVAPHITMGQEEGLIRSVVDLLSTPVSGLDGIDSDRAELFTEACAALKAQWVAAAKKARVPTAGGCPPPLAKEAGGAARPPPDAATQMALDAFVAGCLADEDGKTVEFRANDCCTLSFTGSQMYDNLGVVPGHMAEDEFALVAATILADDAEDGVPSSINQLFLIAAQVKGVAPHITMAQEEGLIRSVVDMLCTPVVGLDAVYDDDRALLFVGACEILKAQWVAAAKAARQRGGQAIARG
jgi:hypothetical protein